MKNTFKIVQYERKVYEPRGEGSRSVAEVIEHLRRFVKKYILKNENVSWDTHQSILALFPDVKVKKEALDCYASSVFKKIKSVSKYSELNEAQKQYVNTKIAKYFSFMRNKCRDIIYNPDIKSETKELAKFFYNENNTKCFGSVLNFPNEDCIYIVNNTPVISLIGWKFADTIDTDKELYEFVSDDFNDVNLSFDAIDPTECFYSPYHYFNESETPYTEPNVNEINKLYQKSKNDSQGSLDGGCGSNGTDNTSTNSNLNNGDQINHIWPKVESEHWETDDADSSSTNSSSINNTDSNSKSSSKESSREDDFHKESVNKDSNDNSYNDDIDELNELSKDSSQEIFNDLENNKSSNDEEDKDQNTDIDEDTSKDEKEELPDAEFPEENEEDSKDLDNVANNLDGNEEIGSSEETEMSEFEELPNDHRLRNLILGTILVFLLILLIILLIGYFFPNLRPEFVDEWISDEQSLVDNNRTQMMNNPSAGGVGGIDGGVGGISGGSGFDSGVSGGSGSSAGAMSMDGGAATSGSNGSSLGGDSIGNSSNSMNGDGNAPINATNTDDNNQQSASKSEDSQFDSSTSEDTKDTNNGVSSENLNEPEGKVPDYQKRVATANMEDMKLSYIFQNDASSVRVIMSDSNKEVCSINSNLQTINDKKVLTTNKEETKDKCGFEITKIECNSNFANCYLVFDSMGWRVAVGSSGISNMPKKDSENNSQKDSENNSQKKLK